MAWLRRASHAGKMLSRDEGWKIAFCCWGHFVGRLVATFSILQRHRALGGVNQHPEDQCAIGLLAEDLSGTRSMFCTRRTIPDFAIKVS